VVFVILNVIQFHHFGWLAFLNGPVYYALTYSELLGWSKIEEIESRLKDEGLFQLRLNRVAMLIAAMIAAQYM
jgi:hypothetical protein